MEHETNALLKAVRSDSLSKFKSVFNSVSKRAGMGAVLSISTDVGNLFWTAIANGAKKISLFLASIVGHLELVHATVFARNLGQFEIASSFKSILYSKS